VTASPAAARRTQTARRLHRERAFVEYFRDAAAVELPLDRLEPRPGPRGTPPAPIVEGLLVGVLDAEGQALGIGRVRAVEAGARSIVIETPVPAGKIGVLRGGRAVWTPTR
jgi:polynucleotide 5'-kinase involved in rRNA processing